MNTKTKGILLTIASALLFGVTPVLASLTYDMGSNASTLTFYRNLMAFSYTHLDVYKRQGMSTTFWPL